MAKRFTETEKWQGWFRRLSPEMKCLWLYICDECDNAGVWRVDTGLADFTIGTQFDWEKVTEELGGRIKIFDNGEKWFITDFIRFQYGSQLKENSNPHQSVIKLLDKYSLRADVLDENGNVLDTLTKGLAKGLDTLKDKDKDKDKDKETQDAVKIENIIDALEQNEHFKQLTTNRISKCVNSKWIDSILKAYPDVDICKEIQKAHAWLVSNPGKQKKNYRNFLNNWFCRANEPPSNDKFQKKSIQTDGRKYKDGS